MRAIEAGMEATVTSLMQAGVDPNIIEVTLTSITTIQCKRLRV